MSMDKPSEDGQRRAVAEAIATRIEREPAFAEQIRNHPWEALLAAGVPESRIDKELFEAIEAIGEVSGYARPEPGHCVRTCGALTCVVTGHQRSSQLE
jgi:hypothetical protein